MMRRAVFAAAALLLAGCTATQIQQAAQIAYDHREGIAKSAEALRKGFADLTPSEEHYIGRAVSAQILGRYKLRDDAGRARYLNAVGGVLARASSRPDTFGGYHFSLVDSPEVNAFAAPGGFIMVTTGLYGLCATEEQLAAVLAHEVAHVGLKHGLAAIKSSRLTEAFTILGTEVAKEFTPAELGKLTDAFAGTIDDVVNDLVVNGYSRSQEFDADKEALRIARRAGYDPSGMAEFLSALDARARQAGKGTGGGFFSTHPQASDRLVEVKGALGGAKAGADPARTARFAQYALR